MKLIEWDIDASIIAFTTTRLDGYSSNHYESMNLALNVGDCDELVIKNREKLAHYLGIELNQMVSPNQTHSTNFKEVKKEDGGKGMVTLEDAFKECDGLYTKEKQLCLMTYHADCIPVLLYFKDKKIIAALHSGWKGTVNQIVDKFIKYMITHEQINPSKALAFIGPSINKENFEAKDDIIDLVKKMNFDTSSFYIKKEDGNYLLDAKGLVFQQFIHNGFNEFNIAISPYCTIASNDLFFSYRKEKQCGRNATIIMMK